MLAAIALLKAHRNMMCGVRSCKKSSCLLLQCHITRRHQAVLALANSRFIHSRLLVNSLAIIGLTPPSMEVKPWHTSPSYFNFKLCAGPPCHIFRQHPQSKHAVVTPVDSNLLYNIPCLQDLKAPTNGSTGCASNSGCNIKGIACLLVWNGCDDRWSKSSAVQSSCPLCGRCIFPHKKVDQVQTTIVLTGYS